MARDTSSSLKLAEAKARLLEASQPVYSSNTPLGFLRYVGRDYPKRSLLIVFGLGLFLGSSRAARGIALRLAQKYLDI